MPYFDFVWELTEDGNVAHIAEHGLTPDDVEPIVLNTDRLGVSRSSDDRLHLAKLQTDGTLAWCTSRLLNVLSIRLLPSK